MAALLSLCFYPQDGWRSWFTPLLQMGIFHDLQSRYNIHRSPYTHLIGAQILHGTSSELIGTVEVSLKPLSPWSPFAPAVAYISNLAVAPPYRCQGVGKQLLLACEPIVRQWGHDHLYLHVLDDNTSARCLYTKVDYQLTDPNVHRGSLIFAQPKRLLLSKSL